MFIYLTLSHMYRFFDASAADNFCKHFGNWRNFSFCLYSFQSCLPAAADLLYVGKGSDFCYFLKQNKRKPKQQNRYGISRTVAGSFTLLTDILYLNPPLYICFKRSSSFYF